VCSGLMRASFIYSKQLVVWFRSIACYIYIYLVGDVRAAQSSHLTPPRFEFSIVSSSLFNPRIKVSVDDRFDALVNKL
jgi:hypothetical protein